MGVCRFRAEWRELVSEWRDSGMSGVEFARQKGLNPNTFAWWRGELAREKPGPVLTLVPVAAQQPDMGCVEVTLADGVLVRLPQNVDARRAGALVTRAAGGE